MTQISTTLPTIGSPNSTEDVDVRNSLQAIINVVNGQLSADNMTAAFAKDVVEPAFSGYKPIVARSGIMSTSASPGLLGGDGDHGSCPPVGVAGTSFADYAFYLDPAMFAAGSRVTKLRLSAELHVNAVAPGLNCSVNCYPVSTWGGASGASPIITALGLQIGTLVTFTAPAANSHQQASSVDVNFPAAGWYVLGLVPNGTQAANSYLACRAELQMRQV